MPPETPEAPDLRDAVRVLGALAHLTRLNVYLDLLATLPDGKASGEIAAATGTLPTNMSAHLAVLARAGLVSTERRGKSVLYAARPEPARDVADLLAAASRDAGR